MAANQVGKSVAGSMETAIHLTGRYPDWWEGKVFEKETLFWASGVTGEATRNTPQRLLVGPPAIEDRWGTAAIPKECILDTTKARGVADLLDNVVVLHGGGGDVQQGRSVVSFMSYVMGRQKWQGPTLDGVWFDEEPPADIYSEGKTRTNATGIFTYLTFTPLLGMSEVVRLFLTEHKDS